MVYFDLIGHGGPTGGPYRPLMLSPARMTFSATAVAGAMTLTCADEAFGTRKVAKVPTVVDFHGWRNRVISLDERRRQRLGGILKAYGHAA
jgi:hypothetical protein